ncbi:MAG: methyltransferase domain-containing protein [Patescibacteria group bacterium]
MSDYLFFFGRTPKLAEVELLTFFPNAKQFLEDSAIVTKQEFEAKGFTPIDWVQKLGGVVKIATIAASVSSVTPDAVASVVAGELHDKRLTFGVSVGEGDQPVARTFLEKTKSILESQGHRVRFVEPRHGSALSSVVIVKNDLIDVIIVKHQAEFLLAKTVAVQDFASWNRRDYGRPFADPKSGMLPPKVARMAVNLAMRAIPALEPGSTLRLTLLDPFCGMGTILGEALLAGWGVVGSDISEKVIEKAKKNIEFSQEDLLHSKRSSYEFFVSDATHVSEHLKPESIDAIVTEPFMGSADIKFENIKNTIKGLEKLYIGCLRDWYRVLKPLGRVVIALPEYRIEDKMFFVKKVIDRCENLGYTTLHGPIEYSRPQAIVRREFFVLQKHGTH